MSVFGVGLFFAGILFVQMGMYLFNLLSGSVFSINVFQFCISYFEKGTFPFLVIAILVNAFIFLTILAFCKKVIQQALYVKGLKKKINQTKNKEITRMVNSQYNRVNKDIAVINCDEPIAFTYGYRKPTIVLSTVLIDLLDLIELDAVIYHESAHQKYFDPFKVFLLQTISEIMWYIPVTKWAYQNYKILIELNADEYAIKRMGSELGLGSALLKLIKTRVRNGASPVLAPFTGGSVDYRIKQLVSPENTIPVKLQTKAIIISISVILLLMNLIMAV